MMSTLDQIVQDARYALRSLAANPGYAAVVSCTLALGIGANTAIFTVVHAVLIEALPFRNAGQLVRVFDNIPAQESRTGRPMRIGALDVRELLDLREKSRTLSHVTSFGFTVATMSGGTDTARLYGTPV